MRGDSGCRLPFRQTRWSGKRGRTLADDLDILLGDLCTGWGFCNDLSGEQLVRDHDSLTGDAFAIAVLGAEGFNPETELKYRRWAVCSRFHLRRSLGCLQ